MTVAAPRVEQAVIATAVPHRASNARPPQAWLPPLLVVSRGVCVRPTSRQVGIVALGFLGASGSASDVASMLGNGPR